ncbi:MAG: folylpolyglutamate synthase/dihydrofolate synthase family protein [Candidatus Omnitrophota bacterium]|nr:folylpolyglutamate synthase/dihydrofolate synthase family protein [Candidatus Omnitrophota bacterium]
MDYISAVRYVDSFVNFEKIPKYQYAEAFRLERMNAILEELGNPHNDTRFIHVAGSKGKGSTCAIAAYILKEAGYKVGLYTSPHLVDSRERIRILHKSNEVDGFEGMIREEEFVELIEEIKPVAEKFRDCEDFGKVSFFEILTACAFLYFNKKKVDAAILETGLGGRLDATNVVMPLACAITNINLEHTDKLGDTLSKIAYEKAGIVKDGGLVVSAKQEKETADVIRKACQEKKAKLCEIGRGIKYSIVSSDERRQVFNLEGPGYSYKDLEMNLIGAHQAENASLAIGMLKSSDKLNIGETDIRNGLKRAAWPGRLQIIQKDPYVVLDGAQNPASISALMESVKALFRYKKLICVFGISSDKDIKGVCNILDKSCDIIILTKAKDNQRAADIPALKENFQNFRPDLEECPAIDKAVQKALSLAHKEDLILITGSLFIVGDAMGYLKL